MHSSDPRTTIRCSLSLFDRQLSATLTLLYHLKPEDRGTVTIDQGRVHLDLTGTLRLTTGRERCRHSYHQTLL